MAEAFRVVQVGWNLPIFGTLRPTSGDRYYMPGYQNTDFPLAVRPEYIPPPSVPRAP